MDTGITEASGPALNTTRNNSNGISTVSGNLGDMKTFVGNIINFYTAWTLSVQLLLMYI